MFYFIIISVQSINVSSTENTDAWVNITLLTSSKFFASISYFAIALQICELYPTSHCGAGLGIASVVASSCGVAAPYIAYSVREKLLDSQLLYRDQILK